MAYDEVLANRVRQLLRRRKGFEEKKMFGGVGFLLHGNMCIGVWKEFLILRIGPDEYTDTLEQPNVKEFDITGRAMRGWVMIEPAGIESVAKLKQWSDRAIEFVRSLPKK